MIVICKKEQCDKEYELTEVINSMKSLYRYVIAGAVYFAMLTKDEATKLQNTIGYVVEKLMS